MKLASHLELGKNVICGMFRMAGHVLRVLVRDPGHAALSLTGTESSYGGTAFWITKRQGF